MECFADIENVLINEVDNPNSVYLYLKGDVWCAYERSAYYLATMKKVVLEKEIIGDDYDIILLKAHLKMDDMSLPLSPGVSLKSVSDDKLQFNMNRNPEGFLEWKNRQLETFPA